MLDEPFVSLDDALVDELLSLFERLRDRLGTATVFVTHAPREADRLVDRVVSLTGAPATLCEVKSYAAPVRLAPIPKSCLAGRVARLAYAAWAAFFSSQAL